MCCTVIIGSSIVIGSQRSLWIDVLVCMLTAVAGSKMDKNTTHVLARLKVDCHCATGGESEKTMGWKDYRTEEIRPVYAGHKQRVGSCRIPNAIVPFF